MLGRRVFPLMMLGLLGAAPARADETRPRVCVVDLHERGWVSIDELASTLRASMNAGEVELVFVDATSRPSGGQDARAAWARRISIEQRGDAVLWVEPARRRFEATLWLLDATGSEPRLHSMTVPGESAFDAHRTLALTARALLRDALDTNPTTGPATVAPAPTPRRRPAPAVVAPAPAPPSTPLLASMGPIARQNGSTVLGWRAAAGIRLPAKLALYAGADLVREESPRADVRRTRVPVWIAVSRWIVEGDVGLRAEVRGGATFTTTTVGNGETATETTPFGVGAGAAVVGHARLARGLALEVPLGFDARLASFDDEGAAERTAPAFEGSLGIMLSVGEN